MVQLSKFNNTYTNLPASANFTGQLENTEDLVSISVNVHCDQPCRVIIKQYRASDLTTQVQDNAEDVPADTRQVVQTPIKAAFYKIEVVNLSLVNMTFTRVTTYLQSTHYVHLDIRHLSQETDNVVMYGVDDIGSKLPIHVDSSGNIVTSGGGGATSDVNIVSQTADLATETTLGTLLGRVTACDTTNVTITGALPTGSNIIGGAAALVTASDNVTLTTMKVDVDGNLNVNSKISANSTDFSTETTLQLCNQNLGYMVYFNDHNACQQTTLANINENIKYCDTRAVAITSPLPYGTNSLGSINGLLTNPSSQGVPMLADVSGNLLVSDTVSEGWLQNINTFTTFIVDSNQEIANNTAEISSNTNLINVKITKCDTDNVAISSGSIDVYGRQSNFNFFPTPENNTINIYADETKGTNVVGGWSFTNTGTPSKINWYIYAAPNPLGNPTTAGQTVASASSVYAVVNQASTSTPAYPFVIIYTRADSGTNAGPFKSRLVFQNSATATTGMKLLYTGTNPVDIHPEITGNNRVNLAFNEGASTKSLAAAAAEEILTCSLQTDSGYTAGRYNFTMAQFGVQWLNTPLILPIQAGKVMVDTGVIISTESSPTGAVTNSLGNTGVVVTGVHSTLQSLTLSNILGTVFSYVKVYNKATAPSSTDTPVMTIPLNHDTVQQVECHSLDFPLGIGLRATLLFDPTNTTAVSGTCYATAFYTNIIN